MSRCHAVMASFSLASPRTPSETFLPSSVQYQVFLLALNHGLLCRAIAGCPCDASMNGAPEWCPHQQEKQKAWKIQAFRSAGDRT